MHVFQSRKQRPMQRDTRIPVLVPYFASRSFIEAIHIFRRDRVQIRHYFE